MSHKLDIGRTVSLSVSLYKSHFKQNAAVAINAALWIGGCRLCWGLLILALAFSIGSAFVAATQTLAPLESIGQALGSPLILLGLLGLAIATTIWGAVVLKLRQAQIARASYQQLINQPETLAQCFNQLKPKQWQIWRLSLRVAVVTAGINFIVSRIQSGLTGIASGSQIGELLDVVLILASVGFILWVEAALSLAHVILAVEGARPKQAVERCWKLTNGQAVRVTAITFVSGLMVLPPYAIAISIPAFAISLWLKTMGSAALYAALIAVGVCLIAIVLLDIFVMPFYPIVQAVTYYGLRCLQEGADVQLAAERLPATQ